MGKSIYQVFTWYIPCINLSYDDLKFIPDIHLLKTFCTILVPVTLRYGHGIYQVYAWFILGISYERFIHGIYLVYTWYILSMISYDWYMFSLFHVYLFLCSKSMTCLDETFTFGLGITFIGAPVFFWIFSAWMGMRFQARQCVHCPTTQCTTCWCPKARLSDPDAVFPFRNTEEVREKVAAERRRLLHRDGTPGDCCKAEVCYILCKNVIYYNYIRHIPGLGMV
jgi:hypothetical protein